MLYNLSMFLISKVERGGLERRGGRTRCHEVYYYMLCVTAEFCFDETDGITVKVCLNTDFFLSIDPAERSAFHTSPQAER
jgi:hypothetical protein